MKRVKVLFHDNCFDGAASAAVFTRFYRERIDGNAQLEYSGLSHKANSGPIDEHLLDGDENAVVDFRYTQSPHLTWWFDHHQSAFQIQGDEPHFRGDRSGKKFYDPAAKSCTKFLARTATERFGFDAAPLADLIYWADLIDGAQFPNAHMAVQLAEPALKLMTVIEAASDPAFIPGVIRDMTTRSLDSIAADARVVQQFEPLYRRHAGNIEAVRRKATIDRDVVTYDLADDGIDNLNKFIAYDLFPQARYTVGVTRSAARAKVSVGSNPWGPPRKHDLARICERYGGGGHPVVAAISFPPGDLDKARAAAAEIASELRKA
jgi:hypothetical protein